MKARFDHKNSTGWWGTETLILEGAHKVSCTLGPKGKSTDLIRKDPDAGKD